MEPGVDVRLEDGRLGLVPEGLDESRVVQLVQDFLADGFERREVGIQEDDAETAAVGEVAEDIDKPEVREHGEHADAPGALDGARRGAPAEKVVLVREEHLDQILSYLDSKEDKIDEYIATVDEYKEALEEG